jgi:hypothetical protein
MQLGIKKSACLEQKLLFSGCKSGGMMISHVMESVVLMNLRCAVSLDTLNSLASLCLRT